MTPLKMKDLFGFIKCIIPWYVVVKKYARVNLRSIAMVVMNEGLLPIMASALVLGPESAAFSFVFFYIYEIGYVHNDRDSPLHPQLFFVLLLRVAVAAVFVLQFPGVAAHARDSGALYLALFVLLAFYVHNTLPELSKFRIVTWLLLNIGKWGVFLGTSLFLAAPMFVPRLFNYLAHKGMATLSYDKRQLELAIAVATICVAAPLLGMRSVMLSAILLVKFAAAAWFAKPRA